jgi:hypothetical protein
MNPTRTLPGGVLPGRRARARVVAVAAVGALAVVAALAAAGEPGAAGAGCAAHGRSAACTFTGPGAHAPAGNPSLAGDLVTYTATIRPVHGGTVAFTDHGRPVRGCAARAVNPATGTATCQVSYPGVGTHQVTAVYSGDAAHAPSTSAALAQQVTYRVQLPHTPATPGRSGLATVITLQLLDVEGTNLSAPGIPVTVTGLSPRPAPGTPGRAFTCRIIGGQPAYQLSLNTTRWSPGTYTLSFTVGTDPTANSIHFRVP